MAKIGKYSWVAIAVLAIFFIFGVVAPNTDAFATVDELIYQRSLPDLTTTHLGAERALVGSIYVDTVSLTIKNQGRSDAGAFTVKIEDVTNEKVLANFEVESLKKDEVAKFETYYRNVPAQYTIQVNIDVYNDVEELDEGNNAPMRIVP